MFDSNGYEKIRTTLKTRANDLGIPYENITTEEEYLNAAIALTKDEEKITISLLQRKLRIGYTRAVRILDAMGNKEIVYIHSNKEAHHFFEPQLVRIPSGKFLMGSSTIQAEKATRDGVGHSQIEWEQPQHEVMLSGYWIGKYPVTNREYQLFIKATGYKSPLEWDKDQYPKEKGTHPVVYISWEDAYAFCSWLSVETNKPYRLPTEAEWEKAARGDDGRIWPWGDEFGQQNANTEEAKMGDTTPVGHFSPQGDSPYGCADMIGNIWEWCVDWFAEREYKNRQKQLIKNPEGPFTGNARIMRGGSFDDYRKTARCASRNWDLPINLYRYLGFRVALSLNDKTED